MLLQAKLYLWTMTVFMIQFETLTVLFILSDAGSSSSSCRIWIMQAQALVDLRRRSFIVIKFSRTVPHTLAYKQLTILRQVHASAMFCCHDFCCVRIEPHCRHESTEFLTMRTDQSNVWRDILIHDFLKLIYHLRNKNWHDGMRQLYIFRTQPSNHSLWTGPTWRNYINGFNAGYTFVCGWLYLSTIRCIVSM